jgi:hypothetical protein
MQSHFLDAPYLRAMVVDAFIALRLLPQLTM